MTSFARMEWLKPGRTASGLAQLGAVALLVSSAWSAAAQEVADRIYVGGPILTMNDAQPRAQALATRKGLILAVGAKADVMRHAGRKTEVVDLAGQALLPGFVDSHGHVVGGGLQALSANLLAPPDGSVTDIPSLQRVLRQWHAEHADTVKRMGAIVGFGYDPAQMAERRHPTAAELDAVSPDVPVYLMHQSGHFGAANSAALKMAGITAKTPDPAGGIIRRLPDGSPNGVLEEAAHFQVMMKLVGGLGYEGFAEFARAGARLWARYGFTTAQEGRAMPDTVGILNRVAAEGGFDIDIVAYPDVMVNRDFIAAKVSDKYVNGVRVGGAKLTIDGSPQGFTAWRDRPYYKPVGDYPPGYAGYAAVTEAQVNEALDWAYKNRIQILTHVNGERAADALLSAIAVAQKAHGPGHRPVLIHGQFLREDQVDTMKSLGVFPSLFPMHTFYWGDWHRDHTVGPIAADDMSPTGWVMQRGMMFGTHHDAPVAFPDSMRVLDATVTRRSRSGDILGPRHRVPVETALKAMTIWPAWQHFEEARKGSLEVGKVADLVVLSADPTAIDPEQLDTLRVERTIKADKVIFVADKAKPQPERAATALGGDGGEAFSRALRVLSSYAEGAAHAEAHAGHAGHAGHAQEPGHEVACLSNFLMVALQPRPALAAVAGQ